MMIARTRLRGTSLPARSSRARSAGRPSAAHTAPNS